MALKAPAPAGQLAGQVHRPLARASGLRWRSSGVHHLLDPARASRSTALREQPEVAGLDAEGGRSRPPAFKMVRPLLVVVGGHPPPPGARISPKPQALRHLGRAEAAGRAQLVDGAGRPGQVGRGSGSSAGYGRPAGALVAGWGRGGRLGCAGVSGWTGFSAPGWGATSDLANATPGRSSTVGRA